MARALRIDKKILVPAPLDRVWESISTAKGLAAWFADRVSADVVEGDFVDFGWGTGPAAHRSRAVVLRVHDKKTVMLRWEDTSSHSRDDYFSLSVKSTRKGTEVTVVDFATKDTRDEVDEVWDECVAKLTEALA